MHLLSPDDAGGPERVVLWGLVTRLRDKGHSLGGILSSTTQGRKRLHRISACEERVLQLNDIADDVRIRHPQTSAAMLFSYCDTCLFTRLLFLNPCCCRIPQRIARGTGHAHCVLCASTSSDDTTTLLRSRSGWQHSSRHGEHLSRRANSAIHLVCQTQSWLNAIVAIELFQF